MFFKIVDESYTVAWQSGLLHLFAKQEILVRGSVGSNPTATAKLYRRQCGRTGYAPVCKTGCTTQCSHAGSSPVTVSYRVT